LDSKESHQLLFTLQHTDSLIGFYFYYFIKSIFHFYLLEFILSFESTSWNYFSPPPLLLCPEVVGGRGGLGGDGTVRWLVERHPDQPPPPEGIPHGIRGGPLRRTTRRRAASSTTRTSSVWPCPGPGGPPVGGGPMGIPLLLPTRRVLKVEGPSWVSMWPTEFECSSLFEWFE